MVRQGREKVLAAPPEKIQKFAAASSDVMASRKQQQKER
jgi:hypothetical protein